TNASTGQIALSAGTLSISGGADFSGLVGGLTHTGGGTVSFDGATPQTLITGANTTFFDFSVDGAGGVVMDAGSAALNVDGALSLNAGNLTLDGGAADVAGALTIGTGRTLDQNGQALTVGGTASVAGIVESGAANLTI